MPWSVFIAIVLIAALAIGIEIAITMRRHPSTRPTGLIAIFGVVVFPVAIVVHNLFSAFVGGDEAVSFILALLVAPTAITLGTIGVAFSLWEEEATDLLIGFAAAGAGMALFAGYLMFALVESALTEAQATAPGVEIVLALAGLAIVGGAASAAFALMRERVMPQRLG